MNENHPPILISATAHDMLAVLRDQHRQQCMCDPDADADIHLSHESTIAQWREACHLLPWAPLAKALNAGWSITIPKNQWRTVLQPARIRTLRGVCELLAQSVKLPRIRPVNLLGSHCRPAGAFLTIRTFLAQAGADVSQIAPSTLLAEYTRRHASVFLGPVSQLAPGVLPLIKIRTPVRNVFGFGMVLGIFGFLIRLCGGPPGSEVPSAFLFGICFLVSWVIGLCCLPSSVEFPGLKTFRDLSKAIAAGQPHDSIDGKTKIA